MSLPNLLGLLFQDQNSLLIYHDTEIDYIKRWEIYKPNIYQYVKSPQGIIFYNTKPLLINLSTYAIDNKKYDDSLQYSPRMFQHPSSIYFEWHGLCLLHSLKLLVDYFIREESEFACEHAYII